jgi:hypothetical protein
VIDGDELPALDLEIALAGEVVHTGQSAAVADVEDHRAAGRLGGSIVVKTPSSRRNPRYRFTPGEASN